VEFSLQTNHSETFVNQENMISKASGKFRSILNFKNILLAAGFLALVCIVFYYNSKDINLKIAYSGFGPHDYVARKIHPENFQKEFYTGTLIYDNSIPMRAYYYLAKYCGISPSVTVYPFMFLQTLLFLLSVAFLTQTLFQNKFVTFISVIVISVSNLAGLNLSRFGAGYGSLLSIPLYYGYSNAFRFFALGFFLKNKYILCFVFLALSIYCHVNMGLFAVAFIGAYLLFKPRLFRDKSVLIGIFLFLVLVTPHIYSIISNASISSGGISVDQWVKSTRIFGYHWYPLTMKLFTRYANGEFFPFLLLCFFFFVALKYQDIKDEKNLKIIVGSIACLIMGLLGIIFSDIYPIPFLIKISLQRSTGLITFFGVLYIIYYCFRKMDTGNIISVFLATFSLLVLVLSKPGIAVLPLFLLLFVDIREGCFGPIKMSSDKIKIAKTFYYIVTLLILLLALVCVFQNKVKIAHSIFVHLWTPLQYFNPFTGYDFLLRGGGFKVCPIFVYLLIASALIAGTTIILRNSKKRSLSLLFLSIFFVISLSTVWYLERDHYLRWHNRYAKVAESYRDVQLWAKKNTPTDALFMPDPSHSYGWRDFSERSSFGNLREWGYCAIGYNPDAKVYREGIKRMREFGIDVEKVTDEDLRTLKSGIYGQKLNRDIQKSYYTRSADRFEFLNNKYKIDYMVMNRKYHKPAQQADLLKKFRIVYLNEHFIVYTSGKQEYDFQSGFSNWKGPDTISMHDIGKTAAPFVLQGSRGEFNFSRISDKGSNVIRVSSFRKGKTGELTIQFGYTLNENGFELNFSPGQEITFIVSVRLSDKTKKPSVLFVQDKTGTWARKKVRINMTSWNQYVVSKQIRDGVTEVCLGISWTPENENEWLEVKDVGVFITDYRALKESATAGGH
jgi:hypothetical protein